MHTLNPIRNVLTALWMSLCVYGCRQASRAALEEARKRADEEERRAREFHAQPVPTSKWPPSTMDHSSPVFTMPEPFHLEGEKRHAEVSF
jgi:hypothetical protein